MKVYPDFDLRDILWYKIGGKARFYIEVSTKQDIKEAFEFLKKEKITKFFFLGTGSNLIFTDDLFDGAVIKFIPGENPIRLLKPHIIQADAASFIAPPNLGPTVKSPAESEETKSRPARDVTIVFTAPDTYGP